ncbi:lipopolysaccharide biosynthesis protein [Knoellia koreensis]|uniref:Lipopolysaccharide biosynthesis protein n=1 Tax=Knoellia koreensis TaxID=2730921 RepID=A0A849HHJ7_9MICO|nr:lipopolysaccharide biosynthesis protein [Knoellia sp. DB2414S]NNM46679.1 lipopolysaccharide biosynthesis protein [Knoellia sp. DB2414S]
MTDSAAATQQDDSLGGQAVRGVAVSMAGQGGKFVIQVTSVVVMAHLLSPRDYGLVAMVVAVTGVAEIFRDFGLSTAAVQAKSLSAGQRSNLFWINLGAGVVLMAVLAAGAPLVALAYGRDELVDITRVLAVAFLINGFASQYRAGLTRELRFRAMVVVDLCAGVIGLIVGVVAALAGAHYWAIVAQQLAQFAAMALGLALVSRWRPGPPDRGAPMGDLVRFGWHLVGSRLISYAGQNTDTVVIGTRFGPAPLGVYSRGYQLLMPVLSQALAPLTNVALPVLSRLQDDRARYDRFIVRGQVALGFTLGAGLGGVIGVAEPLVELALGDRWVSVTPIMRFMGAAGAFQILAYVGYWVYVSRGLTAQLRSFTIFEVAVKVVCIAVGSLWGVVGVAAGFALAPALAWPISLWWLSRKTDLPLRSLYGGALRSVVLAAVVAAGGYAGTLAPFDASWARLATGALAGAAAYLALVAALPRWRADALDVVHLLRRGISR